MNKPKVMLKFQDGYILTKRETTTAIGKIEWKLAQSAAGTSNELENTANVFKEHGYEIVDWDDTIVAQGNISLDIPTK